MNGNIVSIGLSDSKTVCWLSRLKLSVALSRLKHPTLAVKVDADKGFLPKMITTGF